MITLTLNKIIEEGPYGPGLRKGLAYIDEHMPGISGDDEFTLIDLLDAVGIKNAIWCLCCLDYRDYCLFLADVAESVLPIYEKKESSNAPRNAIRAIRDYHAGKIDISELREFGDAAAHAGDAAAYAAAYAAYAAHAAAGKNKWADIELLYRQNFDA